MNDGSSCRLLVWILVCCLWPIATAAQGGDSCFPYEEVHLIHSATIRDEPYILGNKIGRKEPGEPLVVLQSTKGTSCWIRIEEGWILYNDKLMFHEEIAEELEIEIDPDWPIIEGDNYFTARIHAALDYIRSKSSIWHKYVTRVTESIALRSKDAKQHTLLAHNIDVRNESLAHGREHRIEIGLNHVRWGPKPTLFLASMLIHEACHLHQWNAGMWAGIGDWALEARQEVDCYKKQLRVVKQFDYTPAVVKEIEASLKFWERRKEMYGR